LQYRTDDHANSTGFASSMLANLQTNALTAKGLIHFMGDSDFFKFTTTAGSFRVTVNAAQYGPNLVPVAELWSSTRRIMSANAGDSTKSIINANLGAGTYYIMVRSPAVYGDLGQYSVSVTFNPTKFQLPTREVTSSSFDSTYQQPLLAESTATKSGSSKSGAGQGAAPMVDASPSTSKQKLNRVGLHNELFAIESFVDELGGLARKTFKV
jgi:hypothetical protein